MGYEGSMLTQTQSSEMKVEMEKKQSHEQQTERKPAEAADKKTILPVEDSPYVKYKDLEDYKRQGYGTEGHLQPKPGRGGGATDAPTLSGNAVTSGAEADVSSATDAINRQGIP